MTLEWVEPLVRWLGGLLAYITLSVLFFGICFLGWKSLPLVVSASTRTWMLGFGSLLYFASIGLGVQRRRNR